MPQTPRQNSSDNPNTNHRNTGKFVPADINIFSLLMIILYYKPETIRVVENGAVNANAVESQNKPIVMGTSHESLFLETSHFPRWSRLRWSSLIMEYPRSAVI